ncbi:MAG: DUF424 domain-containing protein [Candidatus Heimdallarchaeota archaeon]|nr:DUF424 domain-containing protein [Candidatus Heimdallarchaeota archaeon]
MTSSFFIKIIEQSSQRLVAACDEEIMEMELLSHGVKIRISKSFYGKELVTEKELINEIKRSTSVNVIGSRVVDLLLKYRFIHEDAILWFNHPDKKTKIGHAMLIKDR